jgi:ABC-type polysaccharide/polyol phosphate transport system ATPase subunit
MAALVEVQHVWKRFLLQRDRADSVGQLLVRMLPRRRPKAETFWALQDIDFTLAEGRSLGIIGSNGSGKSTLLKILTRTMQPTSGRVAVRGRVSALIELGAGFHPDFTGRENVYLNASLLGIPRKEVDRQIEDIIEFSGIRPFIDTPVKYYSSGMHARLGFSVAIHVSPKLLIVDEVLAVGDEAFQQKCMDRILAMKRDGVSILLVSHALGSIEALMDEALWIEKGVMRAQGTPAEVVAAYRRGNAPEPVGEVRVAEFRVLTERGEEAPREGETVRLVLVLQNDQPQPLARYVDVALREGEEEVARLSSLEEGRRFELPSGLRQVEVVFPHLALPAGAYAVDVLLRGDDGGALERVPNVGELRVRRGAGHLPLPLPHSWREGA